ncbi:hypothetical protein FSP39_000220 [Pinctada imbricata]|uniref:C2H2-type domain-containing protein n=1 Tax=Pinctada imbricata TaxID=66713 RepID=A0AA88YMF4_PINIB|nr:hypothetical protein FSP39_000220 [Pinctada imbricata]
MGESNLIVTEVYSLKEKDEIGDKAKDDIAANEGENNLSTHNALLSSETEIEDRKKSKLKNKKEGGSRRKAKHHVRQSLDGEEIPEAEKYPGIKIKEEPLDYDEYGTYNGTEYPQIEFDLSGTQTEGEFEYLDGTSVNVARKASNSASQKNLPYEVLQEGDDVVYRCKLCSCRFRFFFKFEAHRQKVHSKKYSCKYCGEQFDRSQILAIHVRVKHVLDSFVKKKPSGEDSHGKIRKFSIAEKKRKHESGLYGSQIVVTGAVAADEMAEEDEEEMYVPRSKKRKIVHKYVDLQGNLVSKAQKRKKLSSTVFIDGKLMYKCSYCNMMFEKQQKMACHVRNQHILEKNNRNRLVYQKRGSPKKVKSTKIHDQGELEPEPETQITTVAEEDLDYMLNEEGDIVARKKDTG